MVSDGAPAPTAKDLRPTESTPPKPTTRFEPSLSHAASARPRVHNPSAAQPRLTFPDRSPRCPVQPIAAPKGTHLGTRTGVAGPGSISRHFPGPVASVSCSTDRRTQRDPPRDPRWSGRSGLNFPWHSLQIPRNLRTPASRPPSGRTSTKPRASRARNPMRSATSPNSRTVSGESFRPFA